MLDLSGAAFGAPFRVIIDVIAGAHVASGAIAIAAGAVALGARKGAAIHIGAGRVFAAAMIISSALGAVLGLVKADEFYITFHAGVLGVTLILSSWLTAQARDPRLGRASLAVGIVNVLNVAGLIAAGAYALTLPDDLLLGFHAADYFFLSGMAGVAALGDVSLLFRKALSDRHRIARHLWRMCLGFFIAAGSAFTGPGAKAFPEAVRNSGILAAPELIIFVLMLFWLARTLLRRSSQASRGSA
ncbi:MAG: hypothetical protein AAFW68_08515 [Pseudomonadota bacterium]